MNHKKPHPLQKSVAFIAALALLATSALAGNVTMTTSDGFGASSFNSAGHWDSGQAPTAGNNYFSAAYVIRTPNSGSTNLTFAGDSLTLNSGGALYCKLQPEWVTINILTNSGKVNNAQGGTFTLLGNMFAPTNTGGGSIDTGSGNSSATDNRTINMMMNLNGSGTLTNWTSDNNWVTTWSAAQGTVLLGGNNVNYTGQLLVYRNTALVVGSQANLGGNPDVFTPGQLTLNVGTLRPNASFAMTNSNSGITIGSGGGNFDIAAGLFLTNAEALVGPGTLALTNAGTLVHLGSAANFTGNLLINNGSFILGTGGSLAGTNTITINSAATFDATAAGLALSSGQTLAGNGTVTGSVTANSGSRISPGGTGNAATLTVSGDLNLNDGAGIVVDFLSTNDVVAVNGNLTPTGVTSIELVNVPAIGTYPLVTVSGTLGGSTNNFHVNALTTRNRSYAVLYDTVSTPNRVLLVVSSSGTAANLVWQGDTVAGLNNAWDIAGTSNWLNGAVSDVYYDGDTNNFTDVGATNQPVLNVTVNPGAVYFVTSSNYTLVGSGAIAGQTAVNKGGTGTVTLSTTNTYSGGTRITNGVLKLGAVQALGLPTGGTPLASVLNTGTLDLNGAALDASYTTTVQVNGDGFSGSGQGAIDNTVGGLTSGGGDIGIASLTLAGNSTVSATANWQIGNTGTGITGNGFVLTKTGNGYLYLKHAAANPLGGFVLAGGAVLFWDHADALGATTPITLTNGGSIDTWNPATYFQGLTFNNPLTVSDPVNGGMIFNTRVPYNHPPSDIYNGPVTLNGTLVFSNNAFVAANQYNNNQNTFGKITMNGNISGPGGIVAIGGTAHLLGTGSPEFYGGNLVTLNGNNSYSGPTLVTNLIQLLITTANQSGGSYDVVDYATVDIAVAAGKPTIPMSSLLLDQSLLGPGNIGFTRLAGMPSVPVVYATNLIINAGVILPPVAGYSIGQFPLIKYDGTIGGNGFGGLQLGSLPAGVAATLVNNTGNHTIDLNVTAAGIQWTGASSTNWDMSTVNWFNPVSASTGTYADGQTVVFGDPATNYTVNLSQIVQP
ncbi:MAG TPA: hypothetical protein VFV81_02400, partial [Verrucomicrobiae bacterium]|nr:hypothetical protein [Verrucomicrobiae bacterium]